jgi:hypothetical protein
LLAIGAFETHPGLGQGIEVGRDGEFRTVTAEFRAQVVDGDEEDVGLLRG